MKWTGVTRAAGVSTCLLLMGCGGAIDPAPFDDYATATRALAEGTTAVFEVDRTWSREVFVQRLTEGDVDSLELAVVFPDDPDSFLVTLPLAPLFLVVSDAAQQMDGVNQGFIDYAELLRGLATDDVATPEALDALAYELNTNATDLAAVLTALGVDVPAAFDDRAAFVSATAVEAFRVHVRERRRETLARALEANQSAVSAWIDVAHQALEGVRDGVQATYTSRKRTLLVELTEGSAARKRRAAEDLADLQAALVHTTRTLAELRDGYTSMAAAHAELVTALTSERPVLTAIAELYRRAKRVATLETELRAASAAGLSRPAAGPRTGDAGGGASP